jgi:CRISPR/Cas system-associated exonuclease Cas4 (RecB family)
MTTNTPTPNSIRVSVSQTKKYMRCQKSWWYQYGPLGIKPPAKASAKLGTLVHHILEEYQSNGTEPPETKAGRIASCGLDKLPDPDGLEIERSITLPLGENSKILCRIDMLGKDRFYVGDHKTTSDFKWAKTRAELNTDVQLLTYAYAAYHE